MNICVHVCLDGCESGACLGVHWRCGCASSCGADRIVLWGGLLRAWDVCGLWLVGLWFCSGGSWVGWAVSGLAGHPAPAFCRFDPHPSQALPLSTALRAARRRRRAEPDDDGDGDGDGDVNFDDEDWDETRARASVQGDARVDRSCARHVVPISLCGLKQGFCFFSQPIPTNPGNTAVFFGRGDCGQKDGRRCPKGMVWLAVNDFRAVVYA